MRSFGRLLPDLSLRQATVNELCLSQERHQLLNRVQNRLLERDIFLPRDLDSLAPIHRHHLGECKRAGRVPLPRRSLLDDNLPPRVRLSQDVRDSLGRRPRRRRDEALVVGLVRVLDPEDNNPRHVTDVDVAIQAAAYAGLGEGFTAVDVGRAAVGCVFLEGVEGGGEDEGRARDEAAFGTICQCIWSMWLF